MSIRKLFSQREKDPLKILKSDKLPQEFKIQLVHLWNEFFYQERMPRNITENFFIGISQILLKEHAIPAFPGISYNEPLFVQIQMYFRNLQDVNKSLDIIEVVTSCIENAETHLRNLSYYNVSLSPGVYESINETNERFKLNGIGFQYQSGKIIRLDNQLLHTDSIEKTFNLLTDPIYSTVNNEFLTAHEHFRFGRNADCLTWCLKSYESIMKVIAHKNGWPHDKGATARPLTLLLFKKEFFPSYLETAMSGLQTFLESSINTIRNKKGGHGSGIEINVVPNSLAQYMLYITGSTINLIFEIQKEKSTK